MDNFKPIRSLAAFYLLTWINKNRSQWPRYVAITACFAFGLVLAAMIAAVIHPAAGEILQNTLIQIGVVINTGLVALAVLLFVAVAAKSASQVVIAETSGARLLSSGAWREPDISPDILIALRPGETNDQFMSRLEQAANECGVGRWVVVIPFRHPAGMVYETPTRYREFLRDCPPFQSPDWEDSQKVCPPATYFRDESVNDYRTYLDRFSFYFREWSARVKVTGEDQPGRKLEILKEGIRASINTLFLSLLSLPCFAQNAAAVSDAIGTRIREIPKKGTELIYEFERREINRIADGKKDYVDLLTSAPMYSDSRGGAFIALYANGHVVAKAEAVEDVAAPADPVRPRGAVVRITDRPVNFSLPDSLEIASRMEQAKERITFYQSEFWRAIRPTWGFVMFFFWVLFPVLSVFGLVLWFWSSLSASEEMPTIHWHSSRGLVILVGSVWTIFIVNAMLTVIWWELPTIPFLACMVAIAVFAWKTAAWIIPNLNARPGGRTAYYNGGQNRPMLPG